MAEDESKEEAPNAERPDPPKLKRIGRPRDVTAVCLLVLVVLSLFYTLYAAREFFMPVALGWMISLILKPPVKFLEKMHIAPALGGLVVLLATLAVVITTVVLLSEPTLRWVRQAPANIEKVQSKFKQLARPAEKMKKAAEEVEKLTDMGGDEAVPTVAVKSGGFFNMVMLHTKGIVIIVMETFVLVYFLLAAGDIFLLKLIQALPKLKDKKRAVEIANETQQQVSSYLFALTLLNIFEGTAIGIGMWLIGMPNPLLWGVMAALVNYVPYIGALTGITIVTLVGFITFDSLGRALTPAMVYLGVNFTDNFIAPYFMGRRLTLNPVMVFLSLMFWGWMWGIVGVLLAVPLLMTIKVFCDHIPLLAPIGEFLAGQREGNGQLKPSGSPVVASA